MHPKILIPQKRTQREIDRAELKRLEFRPGRYTSGSANLDDMIALGKAVILCPSHTRKFSPKAARYRAHPAPNLRRVQGACDVCKQDVLAFLFLNEKEAEGELRKVEKFKRALEYGHRFSG